RWPCRRFYRVKRRLRQRAPMKASKLSRSSLVLSKSKPNSMCYTVILEQEADSGYVATVLALPGCVSQGDTRDEVTTNIRKAADLYIEDCIAAGDPVPTEVGREYFELTTTGPG